MIPVGWKRKVSLPECKPNSLCVCVWGGGGEHVSCSEVVLSVNASIVYKQTFVTKINVFSSMHESEA